MSPSAHKMNFLDIQVIKEKIDQKLIYSVNLHIETLCFKVNHITRISLKKHQLNQTDFQNNEDFYNQAKELQIAHNIFVSQLNALLLLDQKSQWFGA